MIPAQDKWSAYDRLIEWMNANGHVAKLEDRKLTVDGVLWEPWLGGVPSVRNWNAPFDELKRKTQLVFDMEPKARELFARLDDIASRFPEITVEPYLNGFDCDWHSNVFIYAERNPLMYTITVHSLDSINRSKHIFVRKNGKLWIEADTKIEAPFDELPNFITAIRADMRSRLSLTIHRLHAQLDEYNRQLSKEMA